MESFDVFIAHVSWGGGGKVRPVLIYRRLRDVVIAFGITSRFDSKSEGIRRNFLRIHDWRQAGLDYESYIDTNSKLTLPWSAIIRQLGSLSQSDSQRLMEFMF